MGKSLTHKIVESHRVAGEWEPGREIGIRIDQTLTQDATGTMTYLEFEAMGIDAVRTELSVSYVDHNTIQMGYENADDHRYLQTVAARYGIVYSRAGNGICHQVHLERFGRPGKTLLGADSHTPTGGGIGMIAIGAGGIDVAAAMGGQPFYLVCPRVYQVYLSGKLHPWVTAKDVVLQMLSWLGTKGNVGVVLEYGGPGVATLTVPERATIANMGAEMGVTTSIFPSDAETWRFLRAQGRQEHWVELQADTDAVYDRVIDLDLATIEPLCATPHSPGNVRPVRELAGMKVDQVEIGSCTNSSYKDMATVAHILRGKHVHPDVSLGIAPGSRQVLQMIIRDGYLLDMVSAGARILESACGFCLGIGQSPRSGAVSLRTNNRNFEGRSGTPDAQVYLVSPEVAAVAALMGQVTDPRALAIGHPAVSMPAQFLIDDRMLLVHGPDASVEIERGPNIGAPPKAEPLPEQIAGVVTLKVGDKITTDDISPAGQYLKYRSNIPRYAQVVFERLDPTFAQRAARNRDAGIHNVVVGGESYGQGSSREHAAICPAYLGVRAVIVKSLERIHAANLVNFGIVPLTFADPQDYARIEQGDGIEIPNLRAALEQGAQSVTARVRPAMGRVQVPANGTPSRGDRPLSPAGGAPAPGCEAPSPTEDSSPPLDRQPGLEIALCCDLTDRQRRILLAGGVLGK